MSACSFSFANRSDCTIHGTDGCTCVQPSVFEKEKKRMEVVRNSNEGNNIAERDNGDYNPGNTTQNDRTDALCK